MRDIFAENPFLFFDLVLRTRIGREIELLPFDLRIRSAADCRYEVLAARIVQSLNWSPRQSLFFETTRGYLTLIEHELFAEFGGELAGWYRRSNKGGIDFTQEKDFRKAPAQQAVLDVNLKLRANPPGSALFEVSGTVSLECESMALEIEGIDRIDASVASGGVRLYPHDLPAVDASREVIASYFLEILPLMVHGPEPYIFQSREVQVGGAREVWQAQCGIEIIPREPVVFTVSSSVMDDIIYGETEPLLKLIRRSIGPRGPVPVAFVEPIFVPGGGEVSDHGPQRAIVVITDQSLKNPALLAHEIGHVLGGEEAGSSATSTYWVGETETIMDGTGDVKIPIPWYAGGIACEGARKFALVRSILRLGANEETVVEVVHEGKSGKVNRKATQDS